MTQRRPPAALGTALAALLAALPVTQVPVAIVRDSGPDHTEARSLFEARGRQVADAWQAIPGDADIVVLGVQVEPPAGTRRVLQVVPRLINVTLSAPAGRRRLLSSVDGAPVSYTTPRERVRLATRRLNRSEVNTPKLASVADTAWQIMSRWLLAPVPTGGHSHGAARASSGRPSRSGYRSARPG
jgi:hypothetical protein